MNKFLSILFLVLLMQTVVNAQTNLTVSACDTYTLPWDPSPKTASGVFSHIYKNINNVDSIVTISLNINISPTNSSLTSTPPPIVNYLINEQFDAGTSGITYTPTGWSQVNKSTTIGSTAWFSGPFLSNGTLSFPPQSGNGCMIADYQNTTGNNTISNWLISPMVSMKNGDVLKFYTIQNPQTPYADRMEVRMSTNGASTNVGVGTPTATQVGDFTSLLTTINPALGVYVYPQTWTVYTIAISGLAGTGATNGRIAFRYFVTSGGPSGANSDMIGLDNVTLTRTTNPAICAGNNFNLQVNTIGGTGPFNVVLNKNGINFSINPYTNNVNITQTPTTTTTYSITSVVDANGCVPNEKNGQITVNINQPISNSFSVTSCGNYLLPWGANVATSGNYSNTYTRSNGCDSNVTFILTILPKSVTNLIASKCGSYTLPWNTIVTTSGTYSNIYTKTNGCDSTVNITVTIKQPINTTQNVTSCDAYLLPWNTINTTVSGTYSHSYIAANGCDSNVTIQLVIKNSKSTTQNITACDEYYLPWDATTKVVVSDIYSNLYTAANGCDSISIINLTLNFSDSTVFAISSCNTFTLPWNNIVTSSGNYSHRYTRPNACDSIVTIIVTIKKSIASTTNVSACNSYLLPWSPTPVTFSAIYSNTYVAANGCDSISNINVTIIQSKNTYTTVNACINFTLPWGQVVTTSGLYSHIYTAANTCDSTSTINVTVNAASSYHTNITNCVSNTLPWGQVVTTSGLYSYTYLNQNGCDSVRTINVTILPSKTTSFSASAIANYTLPWGIVVNVSGIYSNVYTAGNGCDSIATANITIVPSLNVALKVLLSGPLNPTTNIMNDDLRTLNLIPNTEPYSTPTYNSVFVHSGNGGGESIGSNVLSVSGNNAIVDWVFIEVRSAANSSIVLATKSALVQRDGDIVSALDGVSPINFVALSGANTYFISVRHRNHFGIMTNAAVAPYINLITLDFTNSSVALFNFSGKLGNPSPLTGASRVVNGVRSLYGGNASITLVGNEHKSISYTNLPNSDRTKLFNITSGVNTINGYSIFDLDMNGYARFNGLNPDRLIILQSCFNNNLLTISQQIP
jgi:hypothetical protein